MGFCQSCGRPMGRNDYGTNEDGSPNELYCKDCFDKGDFIEPDISVNDIIIREAKRMLSRNPNLREEEAIISGVVTLAAQVKGVTFNISYQTYSFIYLASEFGTAKSGVVDEYVNTLGKGALEADYELECAREGINGNNFKNIIFISYIYNIMIRGSIDEWNHKLLKSKFPFKCF